MACTGLYVLEILSLHSSRGRVRATPTLGPADNAWRSEWRPREGVESPNGFFRVCLLLMRVFVYCLRLDLTPHPMRVLVFVGGYYLRPRQRANRGRETLASLGSYM